MSLILPIQYVPSDQPRTHALVIGVGDYPHLLGGGGRPALVPMGLAQLTSAPVSAAAFASWLVTHFGNASAPLGSIELLLSPEQFQTPSGAISQVDLATMKNIQDAFDRWESRCSESKDNIAVFYFCGHGIQREVSVLLPADYGASRNNLWNETISLEGTWLGMGECQAKTQCYFIDACREAPIEALQMPMPAPRALKSATMMTFPPRDAPIYKAAAMGYHAHGPPNAVSYFTEALLECFGGVGASHFDGVNWKVTTASVATAVREVMKKRNRGACAIEGASSFITDIHEFTGAAQVMAQIGCDPVQALGAAELSLSDGQNAPLLRGPAAQPWELLIPTGQYDVAATFRFRQFNDVSLTNQTAYPPFFPRKLKVGP